MRLPGLAFSGQLAVHATTVRGLSAARAERWSPRRAGRRTEQRALSAADRRGARRLVVMAKEPRPGEVKTRLAPALGVDGAARLYAAFLDDLVERLATITDAERVLAVWPPRLDAAWLEGHRARFTCVAQRGDGLGARMAAVVADALERDGCAAVVVLGSDLPTLPIEHLRGAFAELASGADAVLGPNPDGGYYLIGLTRSVPAAFEVPMSTPGVLAATRAALESARARVALLPPWHDVDVPADLERLRAELTDPARARLAPRTARLLAREGGPAPE